MSEGMSWESQGHNIVEKHLAMHTQYMYKVTCILINALDEIMEME